MIVLIDVGNTRIKWRTEGAAAVQAGSHPRTDIANFCEALQLAEPPAQVWVASVAGTDVAEQLSGDFQRRWGVKPWFASASAAALGLVNSYSEPRRMGVDRWLAMLAAWVPRRRQVVVIDAGSCLTIDVVASEGRHLGGYILPGIESMERALLSDTDRVRFGQAPRDRLEPGCSTEAAVYNGLLLSQAGAVRLALEQVKGEAELVFSGGNGEQLRASLAVSGSLEPDLVLNGLALLGQQLHEGDKA